MLNGALRAAVLYPLVIFAVRFMGKRQIGELQPTELVITILVSNIATLPVEDQNLPLLMGILPVLVLICFEVLMSGAALRWRPLRRLVSGSPIIIIRNGTIDQQVMRALRFSLDDLMTALRSGGVFDLTEVQMAVVETNGTVSIYQKTEYQSVAKGDLSKEFTEDSPPEVLIADGNISPEGLQAAGYTQKDLQKLLKKHQVEAEQVFLLTVKQNGLHCLVRKENSQ